MINPTIADLERLAAIPERIKREGLFDPHNYPYYDFLYRLAEFMQPKVSIELGTDAGDSACYLAAGHPEGTVLTIGMPQSQAVMDKVRPFEHVNVMFGWTQDPMVVEHARTFGPVDILFVDTLHTRDHAWFEWQTYGTMVRPGGVIIFDDIELHDEMRGFWASIPGQKVSLPNLHNTGFGCLIKE